MVASRTFAVLIRQALEPGSLLNASNDSSLAGELLDSRESHHCTVASARSPVLRGAYSIRRHLRIFAVLLRFRSTSTRTRWTPQGSAAKI